MKIIVTGLMVMAVIGFVYALLNHNRWTSWRLKKDKKNNQPGYDRED